MPVDETTVEGFLVSLALQCAGGYSFMIIMMSIILFHLGIYFYNVAFLKDFHSLFDQMDLQVLHSKSSIAMHMVDVLQFHEKVTK